MKLPVPDIRLDRITQLTPDLLAERGIRLVMLDLDNTIAPYGTHEPEADILAWTENVREAGTELFFVSNSRRAGRVERFAEILGVGFVKAARKPRPDALHRVMAEHGYEPGQCALAGDQIFTDVWAARRAGCLAVVVRPIRFTNPFLYLRYLAEKPFRALRRKHSEN